MQSMQPSKPIDLREVHARVQAEQRERQAERTSTLEAEVARTAPLRARRAEELRAAVAAANLLATRVRLPGGGSASFETESSVAQREAWAMELRALESIDRALQERAARVVALLEAARHERIYPPTLSAHDDVILIRGKRNERPDLVVEWTEPGAAMPSTLFATAFIGCVPRSVWDGGLREAAMKRLEQVRREIGERFPLSRCTDQELRAKQNASRVDDVAFIVLEGDDRWDFEAIAERVHHETRIVGNGIPHPSVGRFPAAIYAAVLRDVTCPRLLHRWWERSEPGLRALIEARMGEVDRAADWQGITPDGERLRRKAAAWWAAQLVDQQIDEQPPGAA